MRKVPVDTLRVRHVKELQQQLIQKNRRSVQRRECPVHSFQKHGKEAQELRDGIEEALDNHGGDYVEMDGDNARATLASLAECLRNVLEGVDARDSLAYIERRSRSRRALVLAIRKLLIPITPHVGNNLSRDDANALLEQVVNNLNNLIQKE